MELTRFGDETVLVTRDGERLQCLGPNGPVCIDARLQSESLSLDRRHMRPGRSQLGAGTALVNTFEFILGADKTLETIETKEDLCNCRESRWIRGREVITKLRR